MRRAAGALIVALASLLALVGCDDRGEGGSTGGIFASVVAAPIATVEPATLCGAIEAACAEGRVRYAEVMRSGAPSTEPTELGAVYVDIRRAGPIGDGTLVADPANPSRSLIATVSDDGRFFWAAGGVREALGTCSARAEGHLRRRACAMLSGGLLDNGTVPRLYWAWVLGLADA